MFWNDPLTGALIKSLDRASLQHKVTAQNIANLNTPGYKRSYIEFSEELNRAKLSLKRTNPRHLPAGGAQSEEPQVRVEGGTAMRTDGNNVDLDREMLDLVTNQLRYNILAQTVSDRLTKWRNIINVGRG
ncbi:MAG: flagellar basal body rod protein FlgB [Firmicutes bacterium]|jgi:flagellar basal-body rod protein FlgB|nr:flagellar basal body rod protein FlgB [Bacillota bacterium]